MKATLNNEENFKEAYVLLKSKSDWKLSIQFFHHNNASEPFLFTESEIDRILLDYVEGNGFVITIQTPELALSFSQSNWLVSVNGDYCISFGSKNDDETYSIIEFC